MSTKIVAIGLIMFSLTVGCIIPQDTETIHNAPYTDCSSYFEDHPLGRVLTIKQENALAGICSEEYRNKTIIHHDKGTKI